jgi:NAD(P)-dependent dehydrogenase (short-subunit alcohol dehydrogenase family)
MDVNGKVAVVTGAGGGIGGALAHALAQAGAKVVVADLDAEGADRVAWGINARHPDGALAVVADVSVTPGIESLLATAREHFGPVDLYCANAGVFSAPTLDLESRWARALDVNLMAHVRAAELLLPAWLARGEGYFVSTASAAGLLAQIGAADYSVTKHAAVAFAEWLSITHGAAGIRVSCLCPMGVDTAMLAPDPERDGPQGSLAARAVVSAGAVLSPAEVAEATIAAIATEQFLVLPHAEVGQMFARKAADYERWLAGMRRYQASLDPAPQ